MIRAMIGSLNALFAATVLFVGLHFALSSHSLRGPLIEKIGEGAFRGLYALAAGASFVWMLFAYGDAPLAAVWSPPPGLRWVPVLVMPVALFLAVAGLTTPSPTAVGGEKMLQDAAGSPAVGILRITRHPFLWGAALWALAHLCVRGDAASIVLMGGILVLALGGMHHIDRRREAAPDGAWGPMALTTSAIPFAALISGRTTMDWKGIGWWRPTLALALYVALLQFHEWLFGVSALPA